MTHVKELALDALPHWAKPVCRHLPSAKPHWHQAVNGGPPISRITMSAWPSAMERDPRAQNSFPGPSQHSSHECAAPMQVKPRLAGTPLLHPVPQQCLHPKARAHALSQHSTRINASGVCSRQSQAQGRAAGGRDVTKRLGDALASMSFLKLQVPQMVHSDPCPKVSLDGRCLGTAAPTLQSPSGVGTTVMPTSD